MKKITKQGFCLLLAACLTLSGPVPASAESANADSGYAYTLEEEALIPMDHSNISITRVEPATVDIAKANTTVTIYGAGFCEGMTVLLGGVNVEYTLVDAASITIVVPAVTMGALDISVTKGQDQGTLSKAITCYDSASSASVLGQGDFLAGQLAQLPIELTASGKIQDVTLQLKLDAAYFEAARFVASDANSGAQISCVTENNVTVVRILSATPLDISQPIGYLQVRVRDLQAPVTTQLVLEKAQFHGVDVQKLSGCSLELGKIERITSSVYEIADGFVKGVSAGTTCQTFLEGFDHKESLTLQNAQGQPISGQTVLSTGMVLTLMDGENIMQSLTIIVSGDANGDGKISITDILSIRKQILQIKQLEGAQALAADYNQDGKINITDYIRLKAIILGRDINT